MLAERAVQHAPGTSCLLACFGEPDAAHLVLQVTEQLQRAQVLLKEHKTVKRLARLVSVDTNDSTVGQ